MLTGEDIVSAARSWIGTPFFHTGREKGLGVDCGGLVIGIMHELQMTDFDDRNYSPATPAGFTRALLEKGCIEVLPCEMERGDIMLFNLLGFDQHVAIYSDGMIHANSSAGKVIEHDLTEVWERRIASVWRFKPEFMERGKWRNCY